MPENSVRFGVATVGEDLRMRPVQFRATWRNWRQHPRFLLAWLALCLVIVPSGLVTRWAEWTGRPFSVGGVEVYLTIYLPMLLCVPLLMWCGFLWAAIPAYLSSFAVALAGGMSLPWIFVFALSNPLGLGTIYLGYRAFSIRHDMRSSASVFYFLLILFAASLAGSGGSFIWAHTNQVGLNSFYPVWQGWWLGGFVQGVLLAVPILALCTPAVERLKTRMGLMTRVQLGGDRMLLALSSIGFVLVAVGYVLIIRRFMYAALDEVIRSGPGGETMRSDLMNIFAGLVLPQWVLICLVAVTLFFGFRVGLLWSIEHRRLAEELKRANATLQKSAISDSMTGLLNRAYLLESLLRELSAAHRHGTPLSCVILDIDRFKQVNDRYGHLAGDEVIRLTGRLIAERARGADIVARFGGEEFVCLMPRTTAEDALTVAEDLRRRIREQELVIDGERMRITASFGVAEATEMDQPWTPEKLLHLADRALYRAKDLGRDRCVRSIELEVGSDQISV